MTCGVCSSPHHYLLHRDAGAPSAVLTPQPPLFDAGASSAVLASQPSRSNVCVAGINPSHSVSVDADTDVAVKESLHSVNEDANYGVVLGTTRIHIADIAGQPQNCRAVLDSGAQSSFITLDCAQRLGLRRNKCPFTVSGLGGEVVKNYGIITCDIKPCKSDVPSFAVDMVVVAKVSSEMPNISFPYEVVEEYKRFDLADPLFYEKSAVDILLGNDVVSELIKDKPVNIKSNIPNVIETVFGYVVSGKLYYDSQLTSQNFHLSVCEEKSLDKTLRDFWEVEELPCKPVLSPLDQLAEDIYANEHSRDESGRYVVPLPFVPDTPPLGDSRAAAERRLLATERKLARSPVLQQAYNDFMLEYEKLDHMEFSPFLAIRTLLQLASDEGERFPSAAAVIRQGIYMDDALWSCETFSQACALQDELRCFHLTSGVMLIAKITWQTLVHVAFLPRSS
ncbi:uncharacterized protein [Choristoneura fumiferana]|uniref:uncharacterized protein n=1 Tax=Choristoneura fumiferana TaxID=7141 RepID=UPI003D15CCE0